ncbi:preprotein translocase subunit YajC [Marininema mesophilum]|uniref:Preprotein translocase subunit YajC n=1 Tax=Marininema mesophilum TaxID=1048340 RepID=A0A1H2SB20_9BACL|nr:preprotein translocase subunit YajC [Marininema mesophilum]SDW28853.1 preprotein translocase subunit YajC [Marininema mesophilum]
MEKFTGFLPIIIVVVIFYFMLLRPQQKQRKQRNSMLASIKKGDKIITIGGLHGTIMDLTDERVTLKVNENSRLVFERSSINAVVSEKEEVKEVANEKESSDTKEEK